MSRLTKINDVLQSLTGRRFSKITPVETRPVEWINDITRIREKIKASVSDAELEFIIFALSNLHYSYGQLLQDLWVIWELGEKERGYFVEFGAFDGVQLSNTIMLERRYRWLGLLAEPNPDWHESIRGSRIAALDTRCVYKKTGDVVVFHVTDQAEFSTISVYAEVDTHRVIRSQKRNVNVTTVKLSDLLADHNAPDIIDYLSMDTEGSEYEVLLSYDWGRHIRCITVEHNYTENQTKIDDLLKSKGYIRRFKDLSQFDAWYIHQDDLVRQ